jgi:hypothetical protein
MMHRKCNDSVLDLTSHDEATIMRYAALLGFLLKPLNPDHVFQPKPRSRLIRMTSSHDQVRLNHHCLHAPRFWVLELAQVFACLFFY